MTTTVTLFDRPKRIEPPFNRTVTQADLSRLGRQVRLIYERLQEGPVCVNWLKTVAAQYNARINELRHWLREFGWTIDLVTRRADGNNVYQLVPWQGSREQARQMAKQAKGVHHG